MRGLKMVQERLSSSSVSLQAHGRPDLLRSGYTEDIVRGDNGFGISEETFCGIWIDGSR